MFFLQRLNKEVSLRLCWSRSVVVVSHVRTTPTEALAKRGVRLQEWLYQPYFHNMSQLVACPHNDASDFHR